MERRNSMRSFYAQFYKNLIWIYLCVLCCFGYHSMLSAIPDHVYLKEGDDLKLDSMLPVELEVVDASQTVMAEVLPAEQETNCDTLAVGEHEVVCYLFGILPVKEVEVSVVEGTKAYAAGRVVGIYGATQGVLVLGSSPVETTDGVYREPSENLVFAGDYIVAVNGEPIEEKEELIQQVNAFGADKLTLTLWRGEELIDVSVQAVRVSNDPKKTDSRNKVVTESGSNSSNYMLGLWVKDDMAGIGTLTYYDENGNFGALGHGIGDGETGELLRIKRGLLYDAQILDIQKGKRGTPGELQGAVNYGRSNEIGSIVSNTDIGIYGTLKTARLDAFSQEDDLYPVGYKQDVKLGDAVMLSDASGELGTYHITIDSMDYSPADTNKGIRFHVDDAKLLDLTGGIVQGLSGSPIIQNGRIVGAVTHVLVNEPTQGYGIFIENMLENH